METELGHLKLMIGVLILGVVLVLGCAGAALYSNVTTDPKTVESSRVVEERDNPYLDDVMNNTRNVLPFYYRKLK